MSQREAFALVLTMAAAAACHIGSAKYPWPAGDRAPATHAEVHTLNEGYDRTKSPVLVRQIDRATRATLDYAAYHANFMIADPPPERDAPVERARETSHPFQGSIDKETLTGDIKSTPLTDAERTHPLAFPPAIEFLQARHVAGGAELEEVGSHVRGETWGLPRADIVPQSIAELFVHPTARGPELWVKIEFAPWFRALGDLPDQDGDGFPEAYGRVSRGAVKSDAVDALEREYARHELSPTEVKSWANQLSSYWYPSFNTDLIPATGSWPDDRTEPDIKGALHGKTFPAPSIVLRGKPQGKPTYDVFIVKMSASTGAAGKPGERVKPAGEGVLKLARTHPTPVPQPIVEAVSRELAERGRGSWVKWSAEVAPFHDVIRRELHAAPPTVKGFAGADGFLFFRNSLEFVVGGDLEKQRKGRNPLPVIVDFKKALEARDVDFLFVPVPSKEEAFPEEVDPKGKYLVGKVVNPYARKLLLSLGQAGVEVVDLLPAFLSARTSGDAAQEPLYQRQDTHWTDRGLRRAAEIIAARIKKYPWYRELAAHARSFSSKETSFSRFGDLQSRLPEAQKTAYRPEKLTAHQVFDSTGTPYEDDPDSPIVVLGDSFAGVYELTDVEHAGVSAHIAMQISYPTDLVMSYGGGPNVRQKLMRRGGDALSSKKLVIWLMTDRDLYNYWEEWEPLAAQ